MTKGKRNGQGNQGRGRRATEPSYRYAAVHRHVPGHPDPGRRRHGERRADAGATVERGGSGEPGEAAVDAETGRSASGPRPLGVGHPSSGRRTSRARAVVRRGSSHCRPPSIAHSYAVLDSRSALAQHFCRRAWQLARLLNSEGGSFPKNEVLGSDEKTDVSKRACTDPWRLGRTRRLRPSEPDASSPRRGANAPHTLHHGLRWRRRAPHDLGRG